MFSRGTDYKSAPAGLVGERITNLRHRGGVFGY